MTRLALELSLPAKSSFLGGSGGAAPAWSPADLGSALRLWLKADVGITLNTGKVAAWADQSGNAIHFTQATGANQPIYNATGLNDLPTVDFVAASQTYVTSADASPFNIGSAFSCFVVGQWHPENVTNSRMVSYSTTGGNDYDNAASMAMILRGAGSSEFRGYFFGSPTTPMAYTASTSQRYGVVVSGSSFTPYLNNAAGTETTLVAAAAMGGGNGKLRQGASVSSADYFDGYISEVVITNTALSSGDRLSLDNYFKAKWGLA